MKIQTLLFIMFAATTTVFAGSVLPPGLGNGQPGLGIIHESAGDDWAPDYIRILADRNLGAEDLNANGHTENLFPFDEQTVFTCDGIIGASWFPRETLVFSINTGGNLISRDVYKLTRLRYGLTTNQWFLGKIGTNIFYWETGKPATVYFRTPEEKRVVNYFKLRKADVSTFGVFGVNKAVSPKRDVGFCVVRSLGWFEVLRNCGTALGQPAFIEFSIKAAKHQRM